MSRFLLLVALVLAACSGKVDTTLAAASFDQRCQTNLDCAPAYTGDVCAPCACNNDAIARSAAAAYTRQFDDKRAACEPSDVGCFCADPVAVCSAGRCVACNDASCTPDAGPPGTFTAPAAGDD